MKKTLMVVFFILLIFMAACGQKDASDKTDNGNKSSADKKADLAEDQEEKAEVEVTDIKYYKWTDESVDSETITVYAEVKNTGNTDIIAGDAKLTFLDADGGVISATSEDGEISPGFIKEGGVGYVLAEVEDDIEKYDDLDKVEIEITPELFQEAEIVEFNSRDTKLNVDKWGQEDFKISVTGFFENESGINFSEDDTSAIMGLYDKDDNFLAAESMYQGQEFSIDANDETSFEVAGGSPLPPEVGEKVDHAEVKAVGIENMEDYSW